MERVEWAAKEVRADEFIQKLDGGYASEVRERGAGPSVGQKQLISFARALAFDPTILILDEATSSIDTETEQLIQFKRRTRYAGPHIACRRAPSIDDPEMRPHCCSPSRRTP